MFEPEEKYMRMAIDLAVTAKGYTSPNPLVGAVIVKGGEVIGKGCHERYGDLHAERNALKSCEGSPEGAVMYVTLEPCCHHGKQPPCTEAIIESGISAVVVGSSDPNPKVAGKGIEILRDAGIEVITGFLEEECDSINKVFFHYITSGMPYVTMKYAMTLDGKIATASGRSKWITSEESREYVHTMRARSMAIMAGAGTVLADDPMLDTRYGKGLSPVRVICDTRLRTPLTANVVKTASDGGPESVYRDYLPKTVIATAVKDEKRLSEYENLGVRILTIKEGKDGHIELPALLKALGEMGIDSVLVEGGATLNWSLVSNGLVDHAASFVAPKIFGGKDARSPVEGEGVDSPSDSFRLKDMEIKEISGDILIEGDVICSQE